MIIGSDNVTACKVGGGGEGEGEEGGGELVYGWREREKRVEQGVRTK